MKKNLSLVISVSILLFGHASFAKTAVECARSAKNIAAHEIADDLDIASNLCKPEVLEQPSIAGGIITYKMDVVCGDASVRANHHRDDVLVFASDCKNASPEQN